MNEETSSSTRPMRPVSQHGRADQNLQRDLSAATLKRKTSKQLTFLCKQQEAKEWIEAVTKLELNEDLHVNPFLWILCD